MKISDLPTPCLILDRARLLHNIDAMAEILARHAIPLRPHMKTAKSIDVARLALAGQPGGITVSTLAEAEYFSAHGITDILLAVGITEKKLEQVGKLNAAGGEIMVITDDIGIAGIIADHPTPPRALIEIDTGEARGGVAPEDPALLAIGEKLGARLAGVMTHAGQSYAGRSPVEIAAIAEAERAGCVRAAQRLREAGHACAIVSVGSSPTARHAAGFQGVTEIRAGVYMFGDLFQAEIGTHAVHDIALTVLASVIGNRIDAKGAGRMLIDAGALALSKDRSTEAAPKDYGYGLVLDIAGQRAFGDACVGRAYQEHGVIEFSGDLFDIPIGGHVRIAPNHACLTAAAHDRYFVVEGDEVIAVWPRVNGW